MAAEALSIIGQRVRDWEEIEKQAQEFVRSPNFRGASEAPGITEVTDSKGDDKVEKAKENTKAQELKTDGNACFQLERYEQAVEKYTEALASSPDSELEATLYSNRAGKRELCLISLIDLQNLCFDLRNSKTLKLTVKERLH